jgi:predicted acetyltransferase
MSGEENGIDLIAIDPALKGSGAFRKLMQPVIDRAEKEGVPVLLDTHDQNNVAIYQRFGFEIAHQFHAKSDPALVQYAMIKMSKAKKTECYEETTA